jgi:hypothetical protein
VLQLQLQLQLPRPQTVWQQVLPVESHLLSCLEAGAHRQPWEGGIVLFKSLTHEQVMACSFRAYGVSCCWFGFTAVALSQRV